METYRLPLMQDALQGYACKDLLYIHPLTAGTSAHRVRMRSKVLKLGPSSSSYSSTSIFYAKKLTKAIRLIYPVEVLAAID